MVNQVEVELRTGELLSSRRFLKPVPQRVNTLRTDTGLLDLSSAPDEHEPGNCAYAIFAGDCPIGVDQVGEAVDVTGAHKLTSAIRVSHIDGEHNQPSTLKLGSQAVQNG